MVGTRGKLRRGVVASPSSRSSSSGIWSNDEHNHAHRGGGSSPAQGSMNIPRRTSGVSVSVRARDLGGTDPMERSIDISGTLMGAPSAPAFGRESLQATVSAANADGPLLPPLQFQGASHVSRRATRTSRKSGQSRSSLKGSHGHQQQQPAHQQAVGLIGSASPILLSQGYRSSFLGGASNSARRRDPFEAGSDGSYNGFSNAVGEPSGVRSARAAAGRNTGPLLQISKYAAGERVEINAVRKANGEGAVNSAADDRTGDYGGGDRDSDAHMQYGVGETGARALLPPRQRTYDLSEAYDIELLATGALPHISPPKHPQNKLQFLSPAELVAVSGRSFSEAYGIELQATGVLPHIPPQKFPPIKLQSLSPAEPLDQIPSEANSLNSGYELQTQAKSHMVEGRGSGAVHAELAQPHHRVMPKVTNRRGSLVKGTMKVQETARHAASLQPELKIRKLQKRVTYLMNEGYTPPAHARNVADDAYNRAGALQKHAVETNALKELKHSKAKQAQFSGPDDASSPSYYFSFVYHLAVKTLREMPVQPPPQVKKPTPEAKECQFCFVIRVGGGYLTAGYGKLCAGCGNVIGVQLGEEPTNLSLAGIMEDDLKRICAELMQEVVAEMVGEIADMETSLRTPTKRLLKQVVDEPKATHLRSNTGAADATTHPDTTHAGADTSSDPVTSRCETARPETSINATSKAGAGEDTATTTAGAGAAKTPPPPEPEPVRGATPPPPPKPKTPPPKPKTPPPRAKTPPPDLRAENRVPVPPGTTVILADKAVIPSSNRKRLRKLPPASHTWGEDEAEEQNPPIMSKSIKRRKKPELKRIKMRPAAKPKGAKDFLALHCILPPEKIARFKALFTEVDTNNSNSLDKDELNQALMSINENLTTGGIDYTWKVLNLMGETGTAFINKETGEFEITFEQFATIAALSEKVAALDSATKKTANDMDFEALEKKMLKAKEMFFIYDTENEGEIPLDQVQTILKAGRIADEHEKEVMEQLTAQGYGSLSFLDFLAYVPLFMDIHDDIKTNTMTTAKRAAIQIQNVIATKMLGARWKKKTRNKLKKRPEAPAKEPPQDYLEMLEAIADAPAPLNDILP